MTGVVEGFRWALLGDAAGSPAPLIWVLGGRGPGAPGRRGLVYFRRMERTFADMI